MKKRIALLLAAVLAVGTLATACGDNTDGGNGDAAKVKVGLGACTSFSESYSIGDDHYGKPATATNAQVDIHVAAVTLDADGKIASCQIDAIQVKASVDGTGAIAADAKTEFTSKYDLKEAYGMKETSAGIGKIQGGGEWYEQIDKYEQWCVGKTIDEVKAGVGEDEYPSDEQLLTGCTIKTGDITKAVADACEKAVESNATTADTLGIALIGELTKATNAADAEDGKGTFQAYVNFAATTQDADGKITSVLIDSIQAYPTWGVDGKLTTDTAQDVRTKYTKQFDYGMKDTSASIGVIAEGGEWFEQIDVFKQSILGKKAADVTAIAVDESGYPTDDTLRTGCTMNISAYKTVVVKSLEK